MSPSVSSRRLCALNTSELFILCSIRLIMQARRAGDAIEPLCREGFDAAHLTIAHALHLSAALCIMETASGRSLDVHNIRCSEIGEDEELVLQILLLLQHENEFGARRVLWRMLPPAASRAVLSHLDEVAIGMVRAGLHLPQMPYALQPCPAEALAARRLGITPEREPVESFWLN
ncbi:MAG: hypothetical protein LCH56_13920 [Proteobacteria bacterium]|nr:hypothetical protein [Pseudomonadota bacterium]